MPADISDQITWLRAQLDDDERIAQSMADARLIDPAELAHALAEVKAKRAILDLWAATEARAAEQLNRTGLTTPDPEATLAVVIRGQANSLLEAVRLLAQPYADRPGWQPEWSTNE